MVQAVKKAASDSRKHQCCIAYLRVSTDKQGVTGWGMDAQRDAVYRWAEQRGARINAEYVETESGRNPDRPQLQLARAHAKRTGCTLVVAKLDRLTRNAPFFHELMSSGAPIAFTDMPEIEGPQGQFMLGIMAQVAQLEAGLISQRTKAALQQAKLRGVKLGNPKGTEVLAAYREKLKASGGKHNSQAGLLAAQQKAAGNAQEAMECIREVQALGFTSHRQIAAELNRRGIATPRGGQWFPTGVARLLSAG